MKFSIALVASFAAFALAAPTTTLHKRAGVLGRKTQISIWGGTAGDAEAEALAIFSALDLTNMAAVDPADIDLLGSVNDIANDAETDAFNVEISAAQGKDTAAKLATEAKKLNNNIALDKAAAGQASTKLAFDATTS